MVFDYISPYRDGPPHLGLCGCRECGVWRSEDSKKHKPKDNSWMPDCISEIEDYAKRCQKFKDSRLSSEFILEIINRHKGENK